LLAQDAVAHYIQDEEDHEKSEGFWREFFLLRPDKAILQKITVELSPDDLLQLQVRG
jgi:hypothetical protein